MPFDTAYRRTIRHETGFSNNPADRGGPTINGITERVARAFGYIGPMETMPVETQKQIYKSKYWDTMKGDDIDALSTALMEELFDTGVNMGVATAGKFLQRALNALNRGGADYQDVVVDGLVGAVTVHVLGQYAAKRGEAGLRKLTALCNAQQGVRYMEIVERDTTQEVFMNGWAERVVS